MKERLQLLDTPGGHMLMAFSVILLGAFMVRVLGLEKGNELIISGASVLFMAMRGKRAEN
jgi:hypothetical protein